MNSLGLKDAFITYLASDVCRSGSEHPAGGLKYVALCHQLADVVKITASRCR